MQLELTEDATDLTISTVKMNIFTDIVSVKIYVDVFMTEHGTKCSTLIFIEDNCIRLEKQVQLYMNVLGRIYIYCSVYQNQ